MDGMRMIYAFHWHGTMSANGVCKIKLPCDATLVQVDAVATTAAVGTVKIGISSNDDAYLKAFTFGASNVPTTADRGDFDGDLSGHDTAQCPHIARDTVLYIVVTHNSMINADLALTFLEG